MDTRTRIVASEAVAQALAGRPCQVVTGHFEVLQAHHVDGLAELRRRHADAALVAVVIPYPGELVSPRARAEVLAALAVIDFVVIGAGSGPETWLAGLRPVAVTHWEEADRARIRRLMEDVQRRQTK
jgi:bifunctional ADP-heptose synthase (sugar kinase/adenylyltransferase)